MRGRDKTAIVAACAALLLLVLWLGELLPLGGGEDGTATDPAGSLEARLAADDRNAAEDVEAARPRTDRGLSLRRGRTTSGHSAGAVPSTQAPPKKTPPPAPPKEGRRVSPLQPLPPPGRTVSALRPETSNATVKEADVQKAVERAVAWLRKRQRRDGGWGDVHGKGTYGASQRVTFGLGPTALALYALCKARQPTRDPVLKKGFAFLWNASAKWRDVRTTSMEASVILLAVTATADRAFYVKKRVPPKLHGRFRTWAVRLAKDLVRRRTARGWRYNVRNRVESLPAGGPEDMISTHLAALALFSARRLGIQVKDALWQDVLTFTLEQQDPRLLRALDRPAQRGFAYIRGHPISDRGLSTGGATACGLATAVMAFAALTDDGKRLTAWQSANESLARDTLDAAGAAQAWLAARGVPFENPEKREGEKFDHYHWLWALETAMDVGKLKMLGTHTWYANGAAALLKRQRNDGSWRGAGTWEPADVLDTSFAVLFLQRAARGLMSSK